ncbi:MAG: HEAT repeat domain-containing protein [Planctomycetes bacterium]|nr:HEAT repeat domain-containing protein [Planctomycetota bacterium]
MGLWLVHLRYSLALVLVALSGCGGLGLFQKDRRRYRLTDDERARIARCHEAIRNRERDPQASLLAAVDLIRMDRVEALQVLADTLAGTDADAKADVLKAMGFAGDPRCLDLAGPFLADGDHRLRDHAVEALVRMRATGTVEFLRELILDPVGPRLGRESAGRVLARLEPSEAIPVLLEAHRECPELRFSLNDGLREVTFQEFVETYEWERWWQSNRDKSPGDWLAAQNERLRSLVERLREQNFRLWRDLLAAVADDEPRRFAMLVEGLGADHAAQRRFSAGELARAGPAAVEPLLARLAVERDGGVQAVLVEGLGGLGDERAVPAVLERLGADDRQLRLAATEALRRLRKPGAVETLAARLREEPDPECAAAMIRVLNDLSRGQEDVVAASLSEVLERQIARPSPPLVLMAAAAGVLAKLPLDEASPVRTRAAAVFRALVDPRFDKDLRKYAIDGLGHLQAVEGAMDLMDVARRDGNAGLRKAALAALGSMASRPQLVEGPARDALVDAVREKVEDTDESVRAQAIAMLPALGVPLSTLAGVAARLSGAAQVRYADMAALLTGLPDSPPAGQEESWGRALEYRADARTALHDLTGAAEDYRRLMEALGSADVARRGRWAEARGGVLERDARYREADEVYSQVLRDDPSHGEGWWRRRVGLWEKVLAEGGDPAEALEVLHGALETAPPSVRGDLERLATEADRRLRHGGGGSPPVPGPGDGRR